jgi:dihydroxyacetone kinase-like predicted kinase
VESLPHRDVLLLPNNKNVVLAASEAVKLATKPVRVVETSSVPQGVAALVAFNAERSLEENLAAMREAAGRVQTIEVTHAVRDTRSNGVRVRKGDVIALVNDKLEHAGRDYPGVVREALEGIGPGSFELVTVYSGRDASDAEAESVASVIRESFPELEVELQPGGQDHYPFILSVE